MNLLYFLLIGTFWGFSFVAIKIVVADVSPLWSACIRMLLSFIFLNVLFLSTGKPISVPKKLRITTWASGFFLQGLPFALLFWGEQHIPAGLASILNGTVPLWTAVFVHFAIKHDENWPPHKIFALLVGFCGLLSIFIPKLAWHDSPLAFWGTCAVLCMALCYSVGNILSRRILSGPSATYVTAVLYQQHIIAFLFLLLSASLLEGSVTAQLPKFTAKTWIAIFYLGTCSTGLAMLLYLKLMKAWGTVKTSLVTYLIPLVSISADFFINGAVPTSSEWLGAGLIFTSLLLMQGKKIFSLQLKLS